MARWQTSKSPQAGHQPSHQSFDNSKFEVVNHVSSFGTMFLFILGFDWPKGVFGFFAPTLPRATLPSMAMPQQSLAESLEANGPLRSRARHTGQLTAWPSPAVTGIASQKAAAMNSESLEILASWWCPQGTQPTAIPITVLRPQAWIREAHQCF